MEKCIILMSTYNGEKYIEEQLDSILSQERVIIQLLVRDDGSTDNTLAILQRYQQEGKLQYWAGENLRPAKSFMELLRRGGELAEEGDFLAFADQDDQWDTDKVFAAISMLKEENADLYYSPVRLYSQDPAVNGSVRAGAWYELGELLLRNSGAGCTMVFRKSVADLVNSYRPKWISMHDSWVIRVCRVCGKKVVRDKDARINYRIHNSNTVGIATSFKKYWPHLKYSIFQKNCLATRTAEELMTGFEERMSPEVYSLVSALADSKEHPFRVLKQYRKEKFSSRSSRALFLFRALLRRL